MIIYVLCGSEATCCQQRGMHRAYCCRVHEPSSPSQHLPTWKESRYCCAPGIAARESDAAVAAGINLMLWHEVTAGICQLQVGPI
jgi:hypothetical protein